MWRLERSQEGPSGSRAHPLPRNRTKAGLRTPARNIPEMTFLWTDHHTAGHRSPRGIKTHQVHARSRSLLRDEDTGDPLGQAHTGRVHLPPTDIPQAEDRCEAVGCHHHVQQMAVIPCVQDLQPSAFHALRYNYPTEFLMPIGIDLPKPVIEHGIHVPINEPVVLCTPTITRCRHTAQRHERHPVIAALHLEIRTVRFTCRAP